jgi:RNA polymerase sigma-70 factor (ECF subfamily)
LRHIEGKEMAEIADGLEISLSTAKRWLKRGTERVEDGIERDTRLSVLLKGSSGQ